VRASNNAELRRLFWDFGTDICFAPGSPQARRVERRQQRAVILRVVKNILGYWWRSLRWLAPLGVLAIAGAFVLRWINKGVLS